MLFSGEGRRGIVMGSLILPRQAFNVSLIATMHEKMKVRRPSTF